MKPKFITITGIDQYTDLGHVASLSGRYPIEWAILFSRNRQGLDVRYPSLEVIDTIFALKQKGDLTLAAHLCGKYAQDIMQGEFDRSSVPLGPFTRIQVNHVSPDLSRLRAFARDGQPVIAQWRDPDSFPTDHEGIEWLYDPSGGRGIAAEGWPWNGGNRICGYAGGILPETAARVNEEVSAKSPAGYWLDMETGVRTNDRLDLELVERVCASVFGV